MLVRGRWILLGIFDLGASHSQAVVYRRDDHQVSESLVGRLGNGLCQQQEAETSIAGCPLGVLESFRLRILLLSACVFITKDASTYLHKNFYLDAGPHSKSHVFLFLLLDQSLISKRTLSVSAPAVASRTIQAPI